MKRLYITTLLLAASSVISYAQTYEQAMELLKSNKRTEARAAFRKLENDEKNGAKASLALTLIELSDEHYPEAFSNFKSFYDASNNPYPYIYALSNTGVFSGLTPARNKTLKQFFQALYDDPKANVTIKSLAASQLAARAQDAGNIKSMKELYRTQADIGPWSTVGTFENTSASGFNKDFGVLAHPENTATFTNRKGAQVKWFDIPDARNDRWWDFEYQYDITNSVIYAQTFVTSDKDQELQMLVGVSGSMKIWVNDFQVASEMEERNTDNDVYSYTVKLQKGTNRILLQLGASEIENSNYMVRFTDTAGNLVTNLTATSQYSAYAKAAPYTVKQSPFFAETFFEKKVAKNPDDIIAQIMLLNVYLHNDKKYEARKVAAHLKQLAPSSTIISEYVIDAYRKDNNSTDITKEQEFIKSNDPESLYGLILQYNDASDKEDWETCEKINTKRASIFGVNENTRTNEITLLSKRKENEKLLRSLEEAYRLYPDSKSFMYLEYLLITESKKNIRAAGDILREYVNRHYDNSVIELQIENFLKTGQVNEAVRLYKKLIADRPYAIGYYTKMAGLYYEMKDYRTALEWQQKAIDLAPYIGSYYYSKGMIYDAMNETADCRSMMKKAIMYSPTNYEARKKLRLLDGKKDLFDYFRTNEAEKTYKDALAAKKDIKENAIYLLNDKQMVVYPENGASEEHNEYLVQVVTQSGVDEYKEVSIPYNEYTQRLIIEKAVLMKKDGSKVQAETNDNQLVFSSLEKGDAIHIAYRLENSYHGKLAENFWDDFEFNSSYQEQTARFSLIVPASRKFQYKTYNVNLEPVVSDVDDYKMYIWEKKDVPAMDPEPYMPPAGDVNEKLVITSIPDWSYVANWYSDLSGVKTKADFEVKEKVKELLAASNAKTDMEKAKVFYNYIEQNCHYSNVPFLHSALTPQRASRTLNTKLGDCKDLSTLFVSMCREAGLDANLVLVDTRDNGDNNLNLPTIGFNHCIAQLHLGDKYYLVELTDNHNPFGAMDYHLINTNGLFIPKDNTPVTTAQLQRLNTNARISNNNDRQTEVTLSGTTASIHRLVYKQGAEASGGRSGYIDTKMEERMKDLNSNLSSEFNKSLKLETLDLKNLDNLSDTMVMDYKFTINNFTSDIVGMQVFKMPWAESFKSVDFVSLDARKYPLNMHSLAATPVEKEVITLKLPAGKKLAELPKNITMSHPVMTYNLTYNIKPDKIIVTREVRYLKDHVSPDEYTSFKNFINKMNEADNKQIAIK